MKNCLRIWGIVLCLILLAISLAACDSGDGDGDSGPALLIGTWDLMEIQGGEHAGTVVPGTATLALRDNTYEITTPKCIETGTYTADATTLTATAETVTDLIGEDDCADVGDSSVIQYSVNSTTLTIIDEETMIWNRL